MWRAATPAEDDLIVPMISALYTEDPGSAPVPEAHSRATLAALRREPARGRAVVLEVGGVQGYALLISFWSNELGGEILTFDEIYVRAPMRGRGYTTALIEEVCRGSSLWPQRPVAVELEVTPDNARARALYARLGFAPIRNALLRRKVP